MLRVRVVVVSVLRGWASCCGRSTTRVQRRGIMSGDEVTADDVVANLRQVQQSIDELTRELALSNPVRRPRWLHAHEELALSLTD